ncbi:hypothetical protein FF011L_27440 [Roseimaritima multifibrata]|uniref:DoxX n=1 Tax=Roseimaritima multifibrata TaxID=1930274 RepID=A0A517MGS7_9BACT|nr:hypothetical protein [Roseimaritima multifibrata]QDS93967.1 hypothetical protein FF011L_27440 [Roseimaritima multifibrata]
MNSLPGASVPEALQRKLSPSFLLLRLGVGIVFFMWTLDKLMNPAHAAGIFERYYMMEGLGMSLMLGIGVVQMILVIAFVTGTFRTLSYSLITVLHTVSTVSCYQQYMNPWEKPNLLFFAAFPMLAACVTLWLLREYDQWTVDGCRKTSKQTNLAI